jgi:putative SOS response-associated peptidase YedK
MQNDPADRQQGHEGARADNLQSSGAWREPWKRRRCLIPANVFYEWEPPTPEDKKQKISKPWAVTLTSEHLFSFGGIWYVTAAVRFIGPTKPISRLGVQLCGLRRVFLLPM